MIDETQDPKQNPYIRSMIETEAKRKAILDKLVQAARPLVPLLKDHKLDHSAAELGAALFELDALDQEIVARIKSDPRGYIDAIFGSFKPR